jgi:hypothetical protein
MLCQGDVLSRRRFVKKTFCQEDVLSKIGFVKDTFCQGHVLSSVLLRRRFLQKVCQGDICMCAVFKDLFFLDLNEIIVLKC